MRITLRQLLVFDAVVRLGSVSEAAREISLTQSAATMALQELERQLGCALFDRQSRRLVPNEHGRQLQVKARSVLIGIADIEQMTNNGSSYHGTLTIGADPIIGNYLLSNICATFIDRHPNINLKLEVLSSLDVIEAVDALKIDIGFVNTPKTRPSLKTLTWREDEQVIFSAPGHRLAGRKRLKPGDLKDETWSLMPRGSVHRICLVLPMVKHVTSMNISFESSSPEAIKRTIRAGQSLGCLSRDAIRDELKSGTLIELPVIGLDLTQQMNIISREGVNLGEGYEEFIRLAMEMRPQ